jgi:hemoglobin/transferrin/lactoferrin receptor protein
MRFLILGFLFLVLSPAVAQEVLVLEKGTNIPLSYVAIYNKNKSVSTFTGSQGKAELSKFGSRETIIFRHVSHHELTITKADIIASGGRVYMTIDESSLQEVVLSVSRFRQKKQEVPQKTISIRPAEIAFSNPQTSADLLQSTGKVYVQKSQLGGGSPMIRGFATNRLLLTVDGVRMNNAIIRSGNSQSIISIDPLAVHEAEVVLGPGSVIYGSDAIGGVMNFYTLKPVFSYTEDMVSGKILSRYSTANKEKTVHADVNLGFEKWAFLSSITYSDFDHLRMGSHGPREYLREEYAMTRDGQDVVVENPNPQIQTPTGYEQINLLQKIAYQPNDIWDFSLGAYYSATSNFPRYDRLYQTRNGQLRSAEWYYGPQKWFLGNFQAEKKGVGYLYDKAKFTAAYQFFEESRNDRNFGGEIKYNSKEIVDAYSVNIDFEKGLAGNKLFYGAEYVLNIVGSESSGRNINSNITVPSPTRYPDGSTWQSLAAYSGFQWELSPDVNMQFGARYNAILLRAGFEDSYYDLPFSNANINTGALTGSAGINWRPNDNVTWKANVSTAFRAPNIDDVGKIFDSEPGSIVVPNPNLKPEYAYNSDFGFIWKIGEAIIIDASSFYTILENAMVRRDYELDGQRSLIYQGEESNIQAIQNAANAWVYGFEGGLEVILSPSLRLLSQLTLTHGREELDNGDTAPLRHAAPLYGNTHLVWNISKVKLDIYGEYNGRFDNEDLAPSEQGKAYLYAIDENGDPYSPAWYTINFTGQYEINENWKATASLENITDQRYRTYSSGIAAAGRNFIMALSYSF